MSLQEWPLYRWNHAFGRGRPEAAIHRTTAAPLHALAVVRTELLDAAYALEAEKQFRSAAETRADDAARAEEAWPFSRTIDAAFAVEKDPRVTPDQEEIAAWTVASDAWFEIGNRKHGKWCARAAEAARDGRSPLFTVHPTTSAVFAIRLPQSATPLHVTCDDHPKAGAPRVWRTEYGRYQDGPVPGLSYGSECGGDRRLYGQSHVSSHHTHRVMAVEAGDMQYALPTGALFRIRVEIPTRMRWYTRGDRREPCDDGVMQTIYRPRLVVEAHDIDPFLPATRARLLSAIARCGRE